MIIRLVRMHIKPEERDRFISIFDSSKNAIRNFRGCTHLELLHDLKKPETISTLSYWEKEEDLEAYRQSELFKGVWEKVKILFSSRAEAVTYSRIMEV